MRTINFGATGFKVPVIAIGCQRIGQRRDQLEKSYVEKFIKTALDLGANFFDNADIYASGKSEEMFSQAIGLNSSIREKIIIQSKCGIVRSDVYDPSKDNLSSVRAYDFSRDHIISSVEGSLKRLKTEYLDSLLLHRPDALADPEEVAEAFSALEKAGKVRHFGVSNQNPMQIKLLQRYMKQPIAANQMQLSITNCTMISQGLNNNSEEDSALQRDGSILDFCRLNDITIQAWSPFQYGFFKGVFLDNPEFPVLNAKINEIAEKYSVANTTIAVAWILRHPAKIQPITGTMNIDRLRDCAKAAEITLTRDEWYEIFKAAGNVLP